jgi:hypothetical protein
MQISTKFDFQKIPCQEAFNMRLMVNIESESNPNRINKPLNLALVLDHSGSMRGDKLLYVKEAAKTLINNLGKDDYFSLTVFDSNIEPLIPPTKAGEVYGIEESINSVVAGNTTNLGGGYQQGFAFAKEKINGENISRVMLLTDGLANCGITDPYRLAEIAEENQGEGISTTTIGVGERYNEFLLGKMAENGGGGAYFIENPDDAPGVFEEELGYLKSLSATDFELKIVLADKNIYVNQLNTYRSTNKNQFLLGDVYERQVKNIVLEFKLPKMKIGRGLEIGHIEVSYRDVSANEKGVTTLKLPLTIDIVNKKDFSAISPDKAVIIASAFLTVAKGKREAIKRSDRREYQEAANMLERCAYTIEVLINKYGLDSPRLITDVNELLERARNLRSRGASYYNLIERKRMYHESDMVTKGKQGSYDAMMGRRKREGNRHGYTLEFPCFLINGHILVETGNDRILIDSGAPLSLGQDSSIILGSRRFPLSKEYMGLEIEYFSNLIGTRFSVLMGADILNTIDYIIDLENGLFVFSNNSMVFQGAVLRSNYFKGIPIINAKTDRRDIKLFFDTGAKISYLKSDIAPDYPVVGQDIDFYPGIGEFQVDTYEVPLFLGEHSFPQKMGILPEMLEMSIDAAGVDGILGTSIFDMFKVCFSASRKQIIIKRYKRKIYSKK